MNPNKEEKYNIDYFNNSDNVSIYLKECELIRQLKKKDGKIIYPSALSTKNGVKFHKTKFGLIKESILIEKIKAVKKSNFDEIYTEYKKTNDLIKAVERLKSLSWGRKE